MKNNNNKKFNVLYLNFNRLSSKIVFVVFIILIFLFIFLNIINGSFRPQITKQAFSFNRSTTTVIIDAGHGGEDGGAISPSDILEKDINLQIALKLKDFLILNGFNVIMIREDDNQLYDKNNRTLHQKKESDINTRISIVNQNKDAIYIGIHQNSFPQQKSVCGSQVFYSKDNNESKELAKIMQDKFIKELNQKGNRSIKEAYSEIMLMKKIENIAVLIECGFLSNPQEEKLLSDESYQSKVAFTIMSSLYDFLLKQDKKI